MSDSTDTSIPCLDLLELARLVRQDGITSDILPAYLQVLMSVRLVEPDYRCRRAAERLSRHSPPLAAFDLAVALRELENRARPAHDRTPAGSSSPTQPMSRTLKSLFACIRRMVLPENR